MARFRKVCLLLTIAFAVVIAPPLPAADNDPGELVIRSTLPLDAAQRARLRQLVASDPEARALFEKVEAEAKRHLDQEPRPLREIHYEGKLNTNPKRIQAVARLQELDDAAAILHYWQATEDEKAAAALRRFISAWAKTYEPTGDDVNENKLYPLFVAYEALRPTFDEKERAVIDSWIQEMGKMHATQVAKNGQMSNRYTKSLRLLAIFARILDRQDWHKASMEGLKGFVSKSLRADGTSFDLEHRDTLTYHGSALRPVIELAVVAGRDGAELYTWSPADGGGSIKRSVDYVRPYAAGEKTRQEWVNSQVKLDHQRSAAGIEAYRKGRLYEPKNARALLEEASYFDPSLVPLVLKLHESRAQRFASWTMVVNAASRP